ncbi:hypothetical protein HanRHA438_Chr01g0012181 [Helianthus annuus]|nr:hypothetical protein HanRHA438_Chr01g0012181 [Helianthus annuus]
MPPEYGALYPSEGDTGADAPAGYITIWADFFGDCNLRLPLTVFVAEVLEWYKIHISQLSPFGMIRIRNFESTFRALGMEPAVGDFRRFYQMTVSLGFFYFRQRDGSPKLMTPPKGITKWKMKFFYIKAAAVVARMTFRNMTETIITETIAVPSAKTVEWFPQLQTIEWVKLNNTQLWVLRMMLTRMNKKSRPAVWEKSGEDAALWRMFAPDFECKVETVACADDEDEFNGHHPRQLPGDLGALGDPDAKGVPKKQVVKGMRFRQKKIPEVTVVPHLVPQAAGISRSSFCRYSDYVIVSDTLEGLGVPGGGAAVGGTAAGSTLAGEKRKPEHKAAGVGELKRRKLQSKRAGLTQKKSAVAAEPQDKDFSIFDAPSSPPRTPAAEAGVPKESAAPFVKVVPDPTVQAEKTVEEVMAQIFYTVDSSNNLISLNDADDLDLRFSDAGKQKSSAEPQKSPAGEKVTGSASGGAGYDGPPIQPRESELEYYYRTYTQDRSTSYHRPPWTVMQGDDISNDPSTCKEILGGLGTPFETDRARSAPRELHINQLSTMLVGSSIVANAILEDYKVLGRREEEVARLRAEAEELVRAARAGAEQLEKDRAAFEKQKQTAEWAATAELKQVRTLAKLLSDERKSWNENLSDERKSWKVSWAKQNETLFRVRQELTNAKAANDTLGKEKAAAEAIAAKAVEAEARVARVLEEAKEAGGRAAKALEEAKERERAAFLRLFKKRMLTTPV